MDVGLKELREQSGRILSLAIDGADITITKNGKPAAKLIPIKSVEDSAEGTSIFGMWSNNDAIKDVDGYVRSMRRGREF